MQDHPSSSSSIFQTLNLESLDGAAGAFRLPGRLDPYDCRYEVPYRSYGGYGGFPYGGYSYGGYPYGGYPYGGGWQPYRATHVTGSSLGSELSSWASLVSTVLPVVVGLF